MSKAYEQVIDRCALALIEKPSHAVPDFSGEGQAQKDWLDVGPTSVERCSPVAMAQT